MIMYACNIIKTYLVHLDASIAFISSESQEWNRLVVLGVHYCRLGFFYVHYVAKSRPNLAVFRYLLEVFYLLSATKSPKSVTNYFTPFRGTQGLHGTACWCWWSLKLIMLHLWGYILNFGTPQQRFCHAGWQLNRAKCCFTSSWFQPILMLAIAGWFSPSGATHEIS